MPNPQGYLTCISSLLLKETIFSAILTGIEGEMLNEISRRLNFTIDVVPLKGDSRWGKWVNNTWKGGVVQAIADQEAEICFCNLWITARLSGSLNFGRGYQVVSVGV